MKISLILLCASIKIKQLLEQKYINIYCSKFSSPLMRQRIFKSNHFTNFQSFGVWFLNTVHKWHLPMERLEAQSFLAKKCHKYHIVSFEEKR